MNEAEPVPVYSVHLHMHPINCSGTDSFIISEHYSVCLMAECEQLAVQTNFPLG